MQAIELDATIDAHHQIHVNVPDTVPPGKARVILLFEPISQPAQNRVFGQFRGMGKVPKDFNDPLPDDFWMGEEQ